MFAHEQPAPFSLKEDNEKALLGRASTKELDPSPNKVDGVTIGFEELTLDVLMVRDRVGGPRCAWITHFVTTG